jgi:hypothetical protein
MININKDLYVFIMQGIIWNTLHNIKAQQGVTKNFTAYCVLIKLIKENDVVALDKVCGTGQAMYLAEQLLGSGTLQTTWGAALSEEYHQDVEHGDLTKIEATVLKNLFDDSYKNN